MDYSSYIVHLCAAHAPETKAAEIQEQLVELHGQLIKLNRQMVTFQGDIKAAREPMTGFVLWVRKSMNDGHLDLDDIESFSDYKHLSEYCFDTESGIGLGLTATAFEELLKTGSVWLNETTSTVFNYDVKSTWKVFLELHPEDEPYIIYEDDDDD